jgi:hypothetical protein
VADQPDYKKIEAINPSLSRHTVRYLKRLKRSGLHGATIGTVARTLIQDQIKLLIQQGVLPMEFSVDDREGDEEE